MVQTLFMLAGLFALVPPTEKLPTEGLPTEPSITTTAPDLSTLAPDELEAHARAAIDELDRAGPTLRSQPLIHSERVPYFDAAPFTTEGSAPLLSALRARLTELNAWSEGDRSGVQERERALTDAVTRLWACATECDDKDDAVAEASAALRAEEARLTALVDAASAEAALVLQQLAWLERGRELRRIREPRPEEPPIETRLAERRVIDDAMPEWALEMARKRQEEARAAARAALDEKARLDNVETACRTFDERSELLGQIDDQVRIAGSELEKAKEDAGTSQKSWSSYHTRIDDLLVALEAGDAVAEQFDDLHREVTTNLDASKTRVQELTGQVEQWTARLETARQKARTFRTARAELRVEAVPDGWDPCATDNRKDSRALLAAKHQVANADVSAAESNVRLTELELETEQVKLDAERATLKALRHVKRRVLPHLSYERQAEIFRYNAEFFRRLLQNLQVLLGDGYDHLRKRLGQLRELPRRSLTLSGTMVLLTGLFWLAVIIFIGRIILARSDQVILAIWRSARARRSLQQLLDEIQGALRLASTVVRPIIRLGIIWFVADYLGFDHPEVLAVYIVMEWLLLYRILRNTSRTLFLGPQWSPERQELFRRDLGSGPVFDRTVEAGRLSDRSLHLIIAYFIWRTAVLTTVDLLLGQDYLYHLCSDVVSVVQWVLIILLIVWWRSRVAASYVIHGPAFGRETVARHADRLWFAILVLPMAAVVITRRAIPWFRETFGRTGPLRSLTNLLSRRAMEQAARTKTSEQDRTPLPPAYQKVFEQRPLSGEPWVVAAIRPVQKICDLYEFWAREKREGSVAIVGEAGMGKTTLINQVLRALPMDHETVLTGKLTEKLSTTDDVIAFLSEVFGFDPAPATLDELEVAIIEDQNPVVVIDDAHHFFLKTMGGMAGLDAFVHVVNVTSHNVFWITAFNSYSWFFIKNLKRSEPPFRNIVELRPWTESELEGLVMARSTTAGFHPTFQDLVIDRGIGDDTQLEVVKTARSYFRLLGDLTGGNPSVAIRFWLHALRCDPDGHTLRVGLYNPGLPVALTTASDDVLFLLTCVASHGSMTPQQIAHVLRMPLDAVQRILAWSEENSFVQRDGPVVSLDLDTYRQVVRVLSMRSFIYF